MFILLVRKISILWHSKEISLSHLYFKLAAFQFKLIKALLIFLDFFKDYFITVWSISSSLDFNFFINLMKISYALLLITLVLAQLTLALQLGAIKDI